MSHLNQQYRILNRSNDILRLSLPSFCIFLAIAILVFCFGQYLVIAEFAPLASVTKRVQCIAGLFLIWVLKLLLIDLAHPFFTWRVSPAIKMKWKHLEEHLDGALQFLKSTSLKEHGKKQALSKLPWFLLIGPHHSGKSSLLAKASIKYILQKKTTSETKRGHAAQFWATKHAIFVETCGDDLGFSLLHDGRKVERETHDATWRYFLYWLKQKKRDAISGVILALPYTALTLSEKMQRYVARRLIERITAMATLGGKKISLHIVITQCDRMSGFAPFFHGLSQEESEQCFGVQLAKNNTEETLLLDVKQQCERLIKQVNQQLIHKLHHEPDVAIKPFIKEFPLQLEQVKRSICELLRRTQSILKYVELDAIYFTSAEQKPGETALSQDMKVADTTAVSVYSESQFTSRAYFVKAILMQLPLQIQRAAKKATLKFNEKIRWQYVLPAAIVLMISALFASDFIEGYSIQRAVQQKISSFQKQHPVLALSQEELSQTFGLLDSLKKIHDSQESVKNKFFSFYTKRALIHANVAYLKSIDIFLIPLLYKNLSGALVHSSNYESQSAYAMLKAYLMLTRYIDVDTTYLHQALLIIQPFHSQSEFANALNRHLPFAFKSDAKQTLQIDQALVQTARQYLWYLSKERLAYIILSNQNNYFLPMELPWQGNSTLLSTDHDFYIPMLFSAKSITTILTNDAIKATKEAIIGNDVLGVQRELLPDTQQEALLISNVRNIYIQAYANYWERMLTKVTLKANHNLNEWEQDILLLKNDNSILTQFLQLVYDNTYFEPIVSISPRLQSLDVLLDKRQAASQQLSLIQKSLDNVYDYVKPVFLSADRSKAAFQLTAKRMQDQRSAADPIVQLRLIAEKSPEPIKTWLQQIANQLWAHLLKEASLYIDIAWQEKIGRFFMAHLSNRYPFDGRAKEEVTLDQFKQFFATSGHLIQFYQEYLDTFIDYEDKAWRWKTVEAERLPFSEEVLKQMQLGLRIHDAFFPNNDDEISVQFSLAARQWGDELKQVMININDQKIIDFASKKEKHLLEWPGKSANAFSSVNFTLQNHQSINRQYTGQWSLFRLVEETFDVLLSKNEMVLDLSPEEYAAKYVISTKEPVNPFSTVKLAYFRLPEKLL